jgi:hypothetical protein
MSAVSVSPAGEHTSAREWFLKNKKNMKKILETADLYHVWMFIIEAKQKELSKKLEQVMPQVGAECIAA